MGIYDRDYTQQDDFTSYGRSGGVRWGLPQTSPVVTYLLIANIVMFMAGLISPVKDFFYGWLAIDTTSGIKILEVWRLISYQFLHADFWHIFGNMLGLFFFGQMLEQRWGSRQFLRFYLMCGIAGGLFYILLTSVHILSMGTMIGASGAVLGVIVACAILHPRNIILFWFFPMPMWVAAIIMIAMSIFGMMGGKNAGGQAAHLAGMATGAVYVFSQPALEKFRLRRKSSTWEKKMSAYRNLQAEVDRILEKVHQSGIQSLTRAEKKTLETATRQEQMRNKRQ